MGVYLTNRLYNENVYTEKEACCISTNFSVVSLGFFALLVSITGTEYMSFALKIVSFVMSIATVSLFLCWYTPIFTWIGMPMIPYLQLCQMPDAAVIAPATLVGCAEIALPVMTIAGQQISEMAIFFVIVLSTVQIIFFTESANAMMKADMGLKFGQLIVIFLIRTVIAIPIVSLFAHIIYG